MGEQKDTENWRINLNCSSTLGLHQCSICAKVFCEIAVREQHEAREHRFPPETASSSADQFHESSTEQQDFLLYFNLVKRISPNLYGADQLANRTHLLKGLKIFGNISGSYKCYFCE